VHFDPRALVLCTCSHHERRQVIMKWSVLPVLFAAAAAKELTSANWDKETAGKQVLVKFQAPW